MNDLRIQGYMNITVFLETFTDTFNVTIGYAVDSKPENTTNGLLFDLSKISETITFEWNLTLYSQTTRENTLLQPHLFRWEFFGLPQFVVTNVFYVFVFVLLICFSRRQPLASRGLTPYFACIIQWMLHFSGIFQFVLTLEQSKANCYITRIIRGPLILSIIFLCIFEFFRYTVLMNLNKKKEEFIANRGDSPESLKESKANQVLLVILKGLGKWYFHVFVLIITHLTTSIIFIIANAASNWNCQLAGNVFTSGASELVFAIFIILLYLLGFAIFFFDIWNHRMQIIKCKILELIHDDIYLFRFEIIVLGLFLTFPFFIIVFILKQTIYSDDNLYDPNNYMNYSILSSFTFHLLFVMQVLFVLSVTIFKWVWMLVFENKQQPETDKKDKIMEIVEDKDLYLRFERFLKQELSVENLVCFVDILKYRKTPDERKRQLAQYIYQVYFNGGLSDLEINVDRKKCSEIKEKIDNAAAVPENLFDNVENTIKTNLYDSYSRFIYSSAFVEWESKGKKRKGSRKNSAKEKPLVDVEIPKDE